LEESTGSGFATGFISSTRVHHNKRRASTHQQPPRNLLRSTNCTRRSAQTLQNPYSLLLAITMFYSETLLSKTGPLARVWLSANIERKLSKNHILQTNVKDSVEAIVTPNQAPMALRLSGQLLLGVVRIYSRKARYLLDDCNEALMKIKMVRAPYISLITNANYVQPGLPSFWQ
jgi:cohesin complex subunit SCC1